MTESYSSLRRATRGGGCFRWFVGCMVFGLVTLVLLISLTLVATKLGRARLDKGAIAILKLQGPIYESGAALDALRKVRKTPYVKAVVVRVDSPGGSVGASEEIYREVMRVRTETKKPVVVSMANVAASGGYYVSLAADKIVANHGTITGSIGVLAAELNIESLLRKLGVGTEIIKSGEHKDAGSPLRSMTKEELNLLQGLVFDFYRQFVREVLRWRHEQIQRALTERSVAITDVLSTSTTKRMENALEWRAFQPGTLAAEIGTTTEVETLVRMLADGRVFTGEQAWVLGLVDELGTFEDAMHLAAKLAKLPPDAPTVDFTPHTGFAEWLRKAFGSAVTEWVDPVQKIEFRAPMR
ncbi:MAG: multidrug transporter [Candidatus Sumerlaea sp.]|nr:MAG: multidrug transporter [Candidatus Sumerlaea sp.]